MAVPHYAYLKLKMPGSTGVITINGSFIKSDQCDRDFRKVSDTFGADQELKEIAMATDKSICKARYAVLFQIWTLPSKPEDEAHIGPTATYDEVIYPGFQHDITALQIQGYNNSYNWHTSA